MRAFLLAAAAFGTLAAGAPGPQQIVFARVFPQPGQIGLFVAAADGSDEHPLLASRDIDYDAAWSPDGKWIAFSSDRQSSLPFAHGRWEHLQLADLYVIHPDGSGLKAITTHGNFCGSPKWTADSRRVVAYCMTAEQTLDNRRAAPEHPEDTRIVAIDVATGAATSLASGPGVKFNPSLVARGELAYIRKDG